MRAALLIVLCTASVAHAAGLTVTMNPASTRPGFTNTPIGIVITIRNTNLADSTINDIAKVQTVGCHTSVTINRIGGTGLAVTLQNQKFAQYLISSPGIPTNSTTSSCMFQIDATSGFQSFQASMSIDNANAQVDFQPQQLIMGSPFVFSETQQIRVFNPLPSPVSVAIDLSYMTSPNNLKFDSTAGPTCMNLDFCNVAIGPGQQFVANVVCNKGTVAGTANGIASFTPSLGTGSTVTWACSGKGGASGDGDINIIEPALMLMGPNTGTPVTVNAHIQGDGNRFTSGRISGGDEMAFQFVDTAICGLNPQQCNPGAPGIDITTQISLGIKCTPDGTPHSSTLTVYGGAGYGSTDTDFAPLSCATTGGGPTISVSPPSLDAMSVPVGTTKGMMSFAIRNDGDANLGAQVMYTDSNWTVDACKQTPCSIPPPPGTNEKTVNVQFAPTQYGPDNVTLAVNSTVGMPTVSLNGVGIGEELTVTTPNPNDRIDFGTIGKNQLVEKPVMLASEGNDSMGVSVAVGAIDPPNAPFATSMQTVTLGPIDTSTFLVSCQAASPGGPFEDDISISSGAYKTNGSNTNAMSVHAKCTIANTVVQVTPSTLDFGEVRKEPGGVRMIEVQISNPGPPVTLSSVTLSKSVNGLSLLPPASGTLDTNETRTAVLRLATDEDTVLLDVSLKINVDAQLAFPITGRVVTPKAHVTPAMLDLGSACVGTSVSGAVMMVNDGTATLRVQPPTMDGAFAPLFISPMTYPPDNMGAPLVPNDSAIAGVTPSSSSTGVIGGILTWSVDAPGSPFSVPVMLEYIEQGAALSPKLLGFGAVEIGTTSAQQKITIQNCDSTPVIASVIELENVKGGVSAWEVQPFRIEKPLGRHDKLEIFVRFAPKHGGTHTVRLQLRIGGEIRFVDLTGEAGGLVRDPESLYACDCNTGGTPTLVFAFGVLLVICRRRTGSS